MGDCMIDTRKIWHWIFSAGTTSNHAKNTGQPQTKGVFLDFSWVGVLELPTSKWAASFRWTEKYHYFTDSVRSCQVRQQCCTSQYWRTHFQRKTSRWHDKIAKDKLVKVCSYLWKPSGVDKPLVVEGVGATLCRMGQSLSTLRRYLNHSSKIVSAFAKRGVRGGTERGTSPPTFEIFLDVHLLAPPQVARRVCTQKPKTLIQLTGVKRTTRPLHPAMNARIKNTDNQNTTKAHNKTGRLRETTRPPSGQPQQPYSLIPSSLSSGYGFFPLRLRNGIFPVSGIFSASTWYLFRFRYFFRFRGIFSASPRIFLALAKSIFLASEWILTALKRNFSRAEMYFSRFRHFCRFQKVFFPLRRRVWQSNSETRRKTRKQTVTQSKHPKQQIQAKTRKQMSEQGRKKQQGTNQSTQATKQTKQPMY